MSKCTPGPWRAGPNGRVIAPEPQNVLICRVGAYDDPDLLPYCRERWDGDTRLIAAAPEMLAVLEELVNTDSTMRDWDAARDVIAKAKGEKT